MLVIGNLRSWSRAGRSLPQLAGLDFIALADLDAALLDRLRPDIVLSALLGEDFDAMDVARRLATLGFQGRYRALTAALPAPGVVRAEVRAVAPGLDFDLFILAEDGGETAE